MDTVGLLQAGFVHQYGDIWRCFLTPCTLIAITWEHANSAVWKINIMKQTKAFYASKGRNAMSQLPRQPLHSPVAHLIHTVVLWHTLYTQHVHLRAEHSPSHYYPTTKCCILTLYCCLATVYKHEWKRATCWLSTTIKQICVQVYLFNSAACFDTAEQFSWRTINVSGINKFIK